MSDCQRCGSHRSRNAFICTRCEKHVRKLLLELPWWLDRLTEAAVGQTRMSDNGGRKSARRTDLDGEKPLAECIEQLPNGDDLDKARKAREQHALSVALAAGGCNARASQLLSEIADSLAYWVRVLCETNGIPVPQLPAGRSLGAPQAIWLAVHVDSIAAHEDAADIASDVVGHLEDIETVINRPIRYWPLGDCPSWVEATSNRPEGPCGTPLRVPAHTEEAQCRRCKTTHNVKLLLLARKHEAEGTPKTRRELVRYNRELPTEFQVPPRTLRHWLATGLLQACAHDGADPLYSWVDVRLLAMDTRKGKRIPAV